ncbi:MAG: hypothetical protein CMJ58_11300 [Planctomycetaceae bacterium]|nr:hypothetical protein [Planctomycetaceae bacterium]
MTNGHTNGVSERINPFDFAAQHATAKPATSQALAKAQQATERAGKFAEHAQAQLALVEQKNQLEVQRLMGGIAGMKSAESVVAMATGDAIANLQTRAQVVLQRGVDIAEDIVEITITDETD